MHWSAGHYEQTFNDYHIQVTGTGKVYSAHGDLTTKVAATWGRNSTSAALAILCCAFGTTNDLGNEPPTEVQIDAMGQCLAAMCIGLDWEINKDTCPTHGEIALIDGYGIGQGDPETRWDLLFLRNGDAWWSGGEEIRGKANYYRQIWNGIVPGV
jgi:hypothetical protein